MADRAGLHALQACCAYQHKCSSAFVICVLPAIRGLLCARTKVLIPPPLNAIAPDLVEGWGDGGQGGIRTRGDIAASHAFQACAFDHSATCPKVSRGMRADASQQCG